MTNLTDALSDLKSELASGTDPNQAVQATAEAYGLKPVFLMNRANAVLGDLSTWAERDRASREALAPSIQAAKQKMAKTQIENRIRAHNAGTARVSDDELQSLIAAANALGGNWVTRRGRQRVNEGDELDQAVRALLRLIRQTEGEDLYQSISELFPSMKGNQT